MLRGPALVTCLLLVPACGAPAERPAATAGEVFRATLAAFARADLDRVVAAMTPAGRERLHRDLEALRAGLAAGPDQASALHRELGSGSREALAGIGERRLAQVLRLFLEVRPVRVPEVPKQGTPSPDEALFLYRDAIGVERPVRLLRIDGAWRVDALHF